MNNINESMLDVYLFEANTLIEQLDDILLNCEQDNNFSTESINEIFRIMHTIKGSSAMMEFNSIMTVAHKIEDLFFYVRENGLDSSYNSGLFDLLFKSSDFLKSEISAVENNQPLTLDIGILEQEINNFLNNISNGKAKNEPKKTTPTPVVSNPEPVTEKVSTPSNMANSVTIYFEEDCLMENLRAVMLISQITEICSDITYAPKDIETNSDTCEEISKNGFNIHFKNAEDLNKCLKTIENFVYVKNYNVFTKHKEVISAQTTDDSNNTVSSNENTAQQNHTAGKQNLINVNLTKLDKLMDLVGEIVITESIVNAIPTANGIDMDKFAKASRELRKLTDELQEIVMSIRMVPVSAVFQKMKRIVRDMSKKLGKDVELELVGEDTEVDKTIVDSISDPLMHLVRNAMDHGIESEEERVANGKSKKGKIILSAENTGGEILIKVIDDGKGLNTQSILKKAKNNGLLTKPEQAYTDKEIYSLIMLPGFSTNEVVTEFSGRGVGMDVVRKNVEKVGGDVLIDSTKGNGSTFLFKIPLTLAIVTGMEIAVGESIFTVPINNIKQSFKVLNSDIIHDTENHEFIMIRNNCYPIVRLHNILGIETKIKDIEDGILILVETNENSYCIFADELIGEQQVVVKPLPVYLNRYNIKECGISGCAILGDGNISLILDVVNLCNN